MLIQQLREVIVEQLKIQDKLRNDTEQVVSNHQTDIREREQIEELFHRDLLAAKDQIRKRKFFVHQIQIGSLAIVILETIRSEYEYMLKMRNNLQRELDERNNELVALRGVTASLIDNLKGQTENISLEKVRKCIFNYQLKYGFDD